MRNIPQHIWDLWNAGGPAVGATGAPHGRVTVEQDWFLAAQTPTGVVGGTWTELNPYTGDYVLDAANNGSKYFYILDASQGFWRYNTTTGLYDELEAFPTATSNASLIYDPTGYVWVFGADGGGIHRYALDDDEWEDFVGTDGFTLQSDPVGIRTWSACAYRSGKVYFAGGWISGAGSDSFVTYDLSSNAWAYLASLDVGLAEINGVWSGNYFYVFGGWNETDSEYQPIGRRYNLTTNAWSTITPPYSVNVAGGPAVQRFSDGTIAVLGGFGDAETNEAWAYLPTIDDWASLPNSTYVGYKHGRLVNDSFYVWDENSGNNHLSRLTVSVHSGATGDSRWWQRSDNSQVETEVPNIENIQIDRSIDQDAATCKITLSNQWHLTNGTVESGDPQLGQPGYFTFSRGESADATTRWGQEENEWNEVVVPDALLRTYQGYGGKSKTIEAAEDYGNIVLTGVWLIDEVRLSATSGKVEITCRDMGKLLIDQQIYPPLAPAPLYPLMFSRWGFRDLSLAKTLLTVAAPVFFGDTQTTPVVIHGTTGYSGAVPHPDYPDYEGNEPGNGYWVLLTDGNLYAFGNNVDYGQWLTDFATTPAIKMQETIGGKGYWILFRNGVIFAFGDAPNLGIASGVPNVESFARNHHGTGYWVLNLWGFVYPYGAVVSHGNCPTAVNPLNFWSSIIAVDIAGDPVGDGYWILRNDGSVFAFGSAENFGDPEPAVWVANGLQIKTFGRIIAHPSGGGYWIIDQIGNVYAFGTAKHYGQLAGQAYVALGGNLPFSNAEFPDYHSALIPTPSGNGYWLVGVSGGVYPFGDAKFLGGLNGPYEADLRTDGNYEDYADIIKQLALWAGFWLYPEVEPDGTPVVFGNVETTGAFGSDRLDEALFDKRPVIDPMTKLKEIVGYHLWIDDEGAFRFESPNIYQQGNFDEDGLYTAIIPEIDEEIQLTDYAVNYTDKSARSEIIISTADPTVDLDDTITTRYTPATAEILRGLIKPAMWVNGVFTIKREQEIMAELIALHIWLAQRQGAVTCMANPAIQINDQVRIWERVTSETYIHYVRGVSSSMDLLSGSYTMNLTTHWMGDGSIWAVDLGVEQYEFGISTPVELTYSFATDDLDGARTDPELATDGNLATSWRPGGGTGQLVSGAIEYIEFTADGSPVDTVGIYGYGAALVFVSIYESGAWQGSTPIAYDPIALPGAFDGYTPTINWVDGAFLTDEGPTILSLPGTYNAERVRITLTAFDRGNWGPQYYVGGIRDITVGLA